MPEPPPLTVMGQSCPSCDSTLLTALCVCTVPCGWGLCCAAQPDPAYARAIRAGGLVKE